MKKYIVKAGGKWTVISPTVSTDNIATLQVGNTVSHISYGVGTVLRTIEVGSPTTIYNPSTLIGVLFKGTGVMLAVPPSQLTLM